MSSAASRAAKVPGAVSPLSKRIVAAWVLTDIIWGALFVYVQRREKR